MRRSESSVCGPGAAEGGRDRGCGYMRDEVYGREDLRKEAERPVRAAGARLCGWRVSVKIKKYNTAALLERTLSFYLEGLGFTPTIPSAHCQHSLCKGSS